MRFPVCLAVLAISSLGLGPICFWGLHAQQVPVEVGQAVHGFQDDFGGATLQSVWKVAGEDVYSVGDGRLRVTSANGDPNHLLYLGAPYDPAAQEVLARMRILDFGSGDAARGGVATVVSDDFANEGINYHFRNEPSEGDRHFEFLDDKRAWANEDPFPWKNDTWYWVRLRHEPDAASGGGNDDVFAKVWLADGSTPEPAGWQNTWNYTGAGFSRTGFAGIVAGSSGGLSEFEVDYFLLKSAGLPEITVALAAFPQIQVPVAITNQPQDLTVAELAPASFHVAATGNPEPIFQWFRNGSEIPGATNTTYEVTSATVLDNGALFTVVARNVASNQLHSVTSREARLTVTPDREAPTLLAAESLGLTQVGVTFSEPVSTASAEDPAHYFLTGPSGDVVIQRATLEGNLTQVVLEVSPLTEGLTYTLEVRDIVDRSAAANTVPAGSRTNFIAASLASQDIGNPTAPGNTVAVPGGYDITAGGTDIGGTADQLRFSGLRRTGNFDLQVRVQSLTLADAWSEAALMARESTDPGSPFVAALATPSIGGTYFQSRASAGARAATSGSFPVNYPNTWLRLRREGNQFTALASRDGRTWTSLGTTNLALPSSLLVGLAVSSHQAGQTATAAFRDYGPWVSVPGSPTVAPVEPPGQSSRLTSLVFSEIMYHPAPRGDGRQLEFIELFNTLGTPEDLSGYRIAGDVDFVFPVGTVIPGGGFLVVARNPADLAAVSGLSGVLGPFEGSANLPNDQGTVRLRNRAGAVFLEIEYSRRPPWPVAADGTGHSLVLTRPSLGEEDPQAWSLSDAVGGSPGRLDPVTPDARRQVKINEVLIRGGEAQTPFVELFNAGSESADLSGCVLTEDPAVNRFVIPAGTTLAPGGFLSWNLTDAQLHLPPGGALLFLRDPDGRRILDAVTLDGQETGVATGRHPDGAPKLHRLREATPASANAGIRLGEVILNELMYHPISGLDDDQYVELFNRSSEAVSLAGWRLEEGISFSFPEGARIAAGGYVVVARNAARLLTNQPTLTIQNTFGDFAGRLSGRGERIVLSRPETVLTTNQSGTVITSVIAIPLDEVSYRDGGRWGQWSDGGGSSLERVSPEADSRAASSWADSDETRKAPWTLVSVTGILDNGDTSADQLQVLLQGSGECLIDDVRVTSAGVNRIANSTFQSNANEWTAEGTEAASGWETSEGYQSSRSYHVRAVERGDNQINRIRVPLTRNLNPGTSATISARVRWLKGHPEVLFRLRGKWLEAFCSMDLPGNLGTPGAVNSRHILEAPPAIEAFSHSPVLPAAGEPVVVTARVSDLQGVGSVQLRYRVDPAPTILTITMRDDGTAGDARAGDGVFSATLPGRPSGTLVAFHVRATDQSPTAATAVFPADAPTRECLIRFGESTPTGNLPVYRLWMTDATLQTWVNRSPLDNTPLDITFVLGGHRVIYNAQALYAGSPYIAPGYSSPASGRCAYSITFPADDRLLGDTDLVLDWPGGHGNERTAMQEQMGYWIADRMDLPYSHRYLIRLHVNGVTDMQRGTVFEAVNQPAGDFLEAWSPDDSDGDFYKIDRAFEFADWGGVIADPQPRLENYTTTGGAKKTERYRYNWLKRSTDSTRDYSQLFSLVDAVNAPGPEPYTSQTEGLVDLEEWMGILATEHIIVNFDAYGHIIGKNMYAYKPQNGGWKLYMFDLDWLMLAATGFSGNYAASTAPLFDCDDPLISRMYEHPPFLRAYYRAVRKAVDGPLVAERCNPVMDAKYASLLANGITHCDGGTLVAPTAVKTWFSQRRAYLLRQLATVAAEFRITSNNGGDFSVNTNVTTLTGTAPVEVKGIRINGVDTRVTWTTVTRWTLQLNLSGGDNAYSVVGYDGSGQPLTNQSDVIRITAPGGGNPLLPVTINEWMAANTRTLKDPADEHFEDWIELYNPNEVPVDLTGYSLTDRPEDVTERWVVPPSVSIAPRGYLLVWADGESDQYTPGAADLHAPFRLSQDGESIGLFGPDGALVDLVTFEAQANDISEGRWPDGMPDLFSLVTPTPRSANVAPPTTLEILGVRVEGGNLVLWWSSQVGVGYRVQYTDTLSNPGWNDLKDVVAVEPTTSITDSLGEGQRYYRVLGPLP